MTTKEDVIEMIRRLPNDVSTEELYVRCKIEKGRRQLEEGKGIPHEEVKKTLARWLE